MMRSDITVLLRGVLWTFNESKNDDFSMNDYAYNCLIMQNCLTQKYIKMRDLRDKIADNINYLCIAIAKVVYGTIEIGR